MPMVAQQPPYTLIIVDDNHPENPREWKDNFGKMVCFHRRYNLGDKHDYKDDEDFLVDLCGKTVPNNEIFKMIIENKFDNIRIEPDEEDNEMYHIKSYCDIFKKWYTEAAYEVPPADMADEIVDISLPFLKTSEMLDVLGGYNVILPLYLYDHSGVTMNTVGFSCGWDSGQVGWIYAAYDDIIKEHGGITPETLQKAKNLLESEVKEYDYYITGQYYGFKLYEGENQINSCWGFFGEISDVSKKIKEHLPTECKNIVDTLQYQYDIHESKYLEQALEDEDEMER